MMEAESPGTGVLETRRQRARCRALPHQAIVVAVLDVLQHQGVRISFEVDKHPDGVQDPAEQLLRPRRVEVVPRHLLCQPGPASLTTVPQVHHRLLVKHDDRAVQRPRVRVRVYGEDWVRVRVRVRVCLSAGVPSRESHCRRSWPRARALTLHPTRPSCSPSLGPRHSSFGAGSS